MILPESDFIRLPPHLRNLFVRLPNPGSDEVVAGFPREAGGGVAREAGQGNGKSIFAGTGRVGASIGDSGSAARFFYTAKAHASERLGSKHPTVKPIDLMRWLVRLVTPPGGTVLDPFAGSGTTGVAASIEGFDCILIEREAEYLEDIQIRIDALKGGGARSGDPQRTLFGRHD